MKSSKSISSNKTTSSNTSFILNIVQIAKKHNLQQNIQQKSTSIQIIKKPYIMISPKLIQELDENNTKRTKLQFENRLSSLQTNVQSKSESQIASSEGQIVTARSRKKRAPNRLSLRLSTQF